MLERQTLERAGDRAVSLDSQKQSRVLNSVYITRIIALSFLPVRPIICPDIDARGADPVPQTSVTDVGVCDGQVTFCRLSGY